MYGSAASHAVETYESNAASTSSGAWFVLSPQPCYADALIEHS
jgi:hypothetical protein